MDDRFPSNSQQPRTSRNIREEIETKAEPEKSVRRVVEGDVVRRKRSFGKRFKELFIGESRSVRDMVLEDILVPGLRDILYDALQSGVEGMIYRGDSRPNGRRRPSQRGGGGFGHVSYDRYSRSPSSRREDPRDRERRGDMSRRARETHDFDEIILPTKVEADEVLSQMYDLLERFDEVTVADLYQLSGISHSYVDTKWGWDDLRGSGITRIRGGGYLLDLPRPEPLKD